MKKYIMPTLEVKELKNVAILAASGEDTFHNHTTPADQLGKAGNDYDWDSDWDE